MPLLTDAPAPRDLQLLEDVAAGYAEIRTWPVWQFVLVRQNQAGDDGDATLRGMPQWQLSYRSFWTGTQPPPDPATPVQLTIHGMVHCRNQSVQPLVRAFVEAVRLANDWYQTVVPLSDAVQSLVIAGADLTTKVNMAAGTNLLPAQLRDVLMHEPLIGSGIREDDKTFSWDPLRVRVS